MSNNVENYEQLKQVIIQANRVYPADSLEYEMGIRILRLADVLLAHEEAPDDPNDPEPFTTFKFAHSAIVSKWNLRDDNLDNQSEETKQFLINLLIPDARV